MERISRFCGFILAITILLCGLSSQAELYGQSVEGEKTHDIHGAVTYPEGRPAAGVHVSVQVDCKTTDVVTDANGEYKASVKGGSAWIQAAQGDYVLIESLVLPATEQSVKKDLKFEYACLVLGEVTDDSTGAAIEGASVAVYGSYGTQTKTSSGGMFKLRVPRRGGLQLTVAKEDYVTQRIDFSAQDIDTSAWRIRLKQGGVVRGRVTDQNGQPAANVQVYITEDGHYGRCARTDENGDYEVKDVDPDKPAEMRIDESPSISAAATVYARFPDGSKVATADFKVKRVIPRGITGRITGPDGSPIQGALVLYGRGSCWYSAKEARTGADGRYALKDIAPGKDMVAIRAAGFSPSFMPVDEKGDLVIDAELEPARSAELTVVDPKGKPLHEASVTVCARTPVLGRFYGDFQKDADIYRWLYVTQTDAAGKVTLSDLPADGVVVNVYKGGYTAPWYTAVRVGATDNVVKMRGTPQVAGTVLDAVTGAPIRSFSVTATQPGSYTSGGEPHTAFTNPEGRFVIPAGDERFLDVSKFNVKVLANGYIGETKLLGTVDAPAVDYSNVFKLEKTRGIKGKITDTAGKAVPGALVTILESGSVAPHGAVTYAGQLEQFSGTSYRQKATTGPDGSFTIDAAKEKSATVIVEKSGYPQLVVDSDLTKPVNLALHVPATLIVKAARLAGEGGTLSLTFTRNNCYTSMPSDKLPADGRITKDTLEPGDYIVHVTSSKSSETRSATLKPGNTLTIDLDKKRDVLLRGRLTSAGKPVANTQVMVRRGVNVYSVGSTTDSEGRYELAVDGPGPATIGTRQDGALTQPIDLKPGLNTYDIVIPQGIVSGRVIDAKGQPVAGQAVSAMRKSVPPKSRRDYEEPYVDGTYGYSLGSAITASDGTFTLTNLPSGPAALTVAGAQRWKTLCIGDPVSVSEAEPLVGVELRVPDTGTLQVRMADARTGRPFTSGRINLVGKNGMPVSTDNAYVMGATVPAGKYVIWAEPWDGRHFPAYADIEILPGKTAKVRLKLNEAKQRIVFRAARGGKLDGLRWPDTIKPLRDVNLVGEQEDLTKGRPWIGFEISDAATGKPVLMDSWGRAWGGMIGGFDSKREAALPIKPGKYELDAVLRNTEDHAVSSKANLWHIHRTVTVLEGKDTIIRVQ